MRKLGRYYLKNVEIKFYEIHPYFMMDGRHVGKISEPWVSEFVGGKTQPENCSYDVNTDESKFYNSGERLEVRSVINQVSFAPSNQVGKGRKVTEEGFQKKLDSLDYFVIVDSREWKKGYVDFYEFSKQDVSSLGLGKNKSMSANKFWKKIDSWK